MDRGWKVQDGFCYSPPSILYPRFDNPKTVMEPFRPLSQPLDRPIRLGVLISGGGTTLGNFLDHIRAGKLSAELPLVIASRPGCGGIAKAKAAGLGCEVVARKAFSETASFSRAIFDSLRKARVDLVVLSGFLSLIEIPEDFRYRVLNIHPALVPAFSGQGFYGHHVHEAALERGVKISGCTVHFADNEYDHGPIIRQKCVPVFEDDTPDTLAERIFQAECELYPECVRLFAEGKLTIQNRWVLIDE
jgi:formyltetrahydrofolate-dependent phosphoribosylglycinamide formyltransferase